MASAADFAVVVLIHNGPLVRGQLEAGAEGAHILNRPHNVGPREFVGFAAWCVDGGRFGEWLLLLLGVLLIMLLLHGSCLVVSYFEDDLKFK